MGVIYRAICPKCGFSEQYNLGAGLHSINLRWCARALPQEERDEALALSEQGAILHFQAENRLLFCGKCRTLKEHAVIDVECRDHSVRKYGYRCEMCGGETEVFSEQELEQVACPVHGDTFLCFTQEGDWD